MPIQEEYREKALSKLEGFCHVLKDRIKAMLSETDPEDLEFGIRLELEEKKLDPLWREAVEENNYMEVVFTEIMEHHDGAYLKATFRNEANGCWAERYVSIRSSGRVEVSYALFVSLEGMKVRVEREGEGLFSLFAKSG